MEYKRSLSRHQVALFIIPVKDLLAEVGAHDVGAAKLHQPNATEPLSKADFTRELKAVINDGNRTNKVFRASEAEAPE